MRSKKSDHTKCPVAGAPFALAARAAPDLEALEQNGVAQLKHLRVGEPRIGHMRLHRCRAVEAGPAGAPEQIVS